MDYKWDTAASKDDLRHDFRLSATIYSLECLESEGENPAVMYQEFVVCNIAGNCITYAENSTIFYFKSVSTWQEEPTAHVRSA